MTALRRLLTVAALGLLAGGCYLDVYGGAARTQGGVTGYGWELGLAGGVAWDIGHIIRPNIAVDGSMARSNAQDGKFGTTGLSYHGRLDVSISGEDKISKDDMMITQAVLMASSPAGSFDGVTAHTRLTLDYGWGRNEELQFMAPGNPMIFTRRSTVHSFYLGIAREYDTGPVAVSFGIGPHFTYMPNEFVGDATSLGVQGHFSAWFIPVARLKKSGSMFDSYSGPTPIKPLPTAPDPVTCVNEYGTRVPC